MGDQTNPDIVVSYGTENFPSSNWYNIFGAVKSFSVRSGNAYKVGYAEIVLRNIDGNLTSGSNPISLGKPIKIDVDVRGDPDTIFYGRVYRRKVKKDGDKPEILTLYCFGLERKFLEETITRSYRDEFLSGAVDWTMASALNNAITSPDSDESTGYTLQTEGLITSTPPLTNYKNTPLMDVIRDVADALDYDGYFEVDALNNKVFVFKPVGTVVPVVPVVLDSSTAKFSYEFDDSIEQLANHVFVHGDKDEGIPFDKDYFTEDDLTSYWSGEDGTTVEEYSAESKVGSKCVHAVKSEANLVVFKLDISALDSDITKYDAMHFFYKHLIYNLYPENIREAKVASISLIDSSNQVINFKKDLKAKHNVWNEYDIPLPSSVDNIYPIGLFSDNKKMPSNSWYQIGSSVTFDLTNVKYLKFVGFKSTNPSMAMFGYTTDIFIDGFFLRGGLMIDAIALRGRIGEASAPIVQDASSIAEYGRFVYHEQDRLIKSIAQARGVAEYILRTRKNPIKTIKTETLGLPYLRPNQTVTVTLPTLDISNEVYRTVEVRHEWNSAKKTFKTFLELVPQYASLNSKAYIAESYEALLASI